MYSRDKFPSTLVSHTSPALGTENGHLPDQGTIPELSESCKGNKPSNEFYAEIYRGLWEEKKTKKYRERSLRRRVTSVDYSRGPKMHPSHRLLIKSKTKPDVVFCSLTGKITYKNFVKINNYDLYLTNSEINKCDGICIYVKKEIVYTNEVINVGWTKAIFTKVNMKPEAVYLTSFYRSHGVYLLQIWLKT